MKKSLSILLSVLMVLSCVSCLFTMPLTASAAEELPTNLVSNRDTGESCLELSSKLEKDTPYQLDFTLNVGDSASGKAYPAFYGEDKTTPQATYYGLVGVKYQAGTPGAVSTVLNYTADASAFSEANVAALEAGEYKYTYVFYATGSEIGSVQLVIPEGVAVADAKLFSLAGTQWDDFYYQGDQIVRYLVDDNGDVVQRIYGYRTISDTAQAFNKYTLSAKKGGKLYDFFVEKGQVPAINGAIRLVKGSGELTVPTSSETIDYTHFPVFNFYETTKEIVSFSKPMIEVCYGESGEGPYPAYKGSAEMGNQERMSNVTKVDAITGEEQIISIRDYNTYADPDKGSFNASAQYRRVSGMHQMVATLTYYKDKSGEPNNRVGGISGSGTYPTRTDEGSAATRVAPAVFTRLNTNDWVYMSQNINTAHSSFNYGRKTYNENDNSFTAEDIVNTYKALKNLKNGDYLRFRYDSTTGKLVKNSWGSAYVAPATDNAYCGVALQYIGKGYTYDLDNVSISGVTAAAQPAVEYQKPDGTVVTPSDATATVTASYSNDTYAGRNVKFAVSNADANSMFKGLYNAETGELVSDDINYTLTRGTYTATPLKAVFTYDKVAATTAVVDKNGEATTVPTADNTTITAVANINADDATKIDLSVSGINRDCFTFAGWYNDGTLVTKNATATVNRADYDNSAWQAVVIYNNLLATGSYENASGTLRLDIAEKSITYDQDGDGVAETTYTKKLWTSDPTGEKWGYNTYQPFGTALPAQVAYDRENNPYMYPARWWGTSGVGVQNYYEVVSGTQNNIKLADGSKVSVTPHSGNKMLRLSRLETKDAVRAIEGLTKGKTYTLSFYGWSSGESDRQTDVSYIARPFVATHFLGFENDGSLLDVRSFEGDMNYGQFCLGKDTTTNVADLMGKWTKYEVTFTAQTETAYLHVMIGGSSEWKGDSFCYMDDFCLVESGDFTKTNWDFEDESTQNIVTVNTGSIEVVDAEEDAPAKIGSKYLKVSTGGKAYSSPTFSFNYNGANKYVISFDMKIFNYQTAGSNGLRINLQPRNDGDIYTNNTLTKELYSIASNRQALMTRYSEEGNMIKDQVDQFAETKVTTESWRKLNNGVMPYVGGEGMSGQNQDTLKFYRSGAQWEKWQHFEIEVEAGASNWNGAVEFSVNFIDPGWVVGLDNVNVEAYGAAEIEDADAATAGTKAYNIRNASYKVNQGLRFKSTIDISAREALANGAKIVEYGTLAMTAKGYISGHNLVYSMAGVNVVKGAAYIEGGDVDLQFENDGTTITYTGVLTNIGVQYFDVDWAVRGYVVIEYADGRRTVVYDDVQTLSVYDAATNIIKNVSEDHNDYASAKAAVDAYHEYLAAQQ